MCPGCGISKDQLGIARAGITSVDPVGRSCAALDPANNFNVVVIALCQDRDFGKLPLRSACGAGKDHVVHCRSA